MSGAPIVSAGSKPQRFRKKPVVIEAIQYTGIYTQEIKA